MSKKITTANDALTYKVIGICMDIHNALGPGHREVVYHNALRSAFAQAELAFEFEPELPVTNEANETLIVYRPDFRINQSVWLEIKALSHQLTNDEIAQVIDYFAADGLKTCQSALLVNFGRKRLDWKRVLPPKTISEHLRKSWGKDGDGKAISGSPILSNARSASDDAHPLIRSTSVESRKIMSTMNVPIFTGPGRLEYQDHPVPRITRDDEVLLAVEASGICGTDLNILAVPPAHKAKPGIVIGHEGVAKVAEVGAGVGGLKPGDRVVIAPRLTCGNCEYCRRGLDNQCTNYQTIGTTLDGTFAPFAIAPERALYKVSDAVSLDDAALFEPLSCVVGAFAKAPVKPGDNVCVIGAGPMGALFAMHARASGAGRVIMADVVPYRLAYAQEVLGAIPVNSKETDLRTAVMDATGIGCDIVIDAVGNQLASAMNLARRGGTVILFGLRPNDTQQVSQYHITRYDLNVIGAFVGLNPFVQTINLLESGRIKPSALITHKLPLSELSHGVDLMRGGQAMKVLITM